MSKKTYFDSIANAFNEAKAWRTAAFSLGAAVVFLTGALIFTAQNAPTVLVPHDFATNNGPVKVATNGSIRGTSNEYLVNLALSDIALITNFTPDTVQTQYERFLNRTTQALYGSQGDALRAEAANLKKNATTQAFFPSDKTSVSPDGTRVVATGTLIRWEGDREIIRQSATYVITYSVFKGYFHIKDVHIADSAKEAAKETQKNAAQ
jgi:type IV conjugative transfer system protein TraE